MPRTSFAAIGICLTAFAAVADEPAPALAERAEKLMAQVKSAMRAGRYAEAIPLQTELVDIARQMYPPNSHPRGHAAIAVELANLGESLRDAGKFELASKPFEEAAAMLRGLYPPAEYPHGHPKLAAVLGNHASAERQAGRSDRARQLIVEAIQIQRAAVAATEVSAGLSELADSLTQLGLIENGMGRADTAAAAVDESLTIQRRLYAAPKYPRGHINLLTSLATRGLIEHGRGQTLKALPFFEESLALARGLYPAAEYPAGHPNLATALNNVAALQQLAGRLAFARPLHEESYEMRRKSFPESRYPDGHPDLLQSLNNLSTMCLDMRELPRAMTYGERAVSMARKLFPAARFPDGHPEFANALGNFAVACQEARLYRQALPPCEEAVAQLRRLFPAAKFPDGNSELAGRLFTLGVIYAGLDEPNRSVEVLNEAVAMYRRLFPAAKYANGHPDVAAALNGLGHVYSTFRRGDEAAAAFREALAIREKLYPLTRFPNGHPALMTSLNNVGLLHLNAKRYDEARPILDRLVALNEKLYPQQHFPNGSPEMSLAHLYRGRLEWATTTAASAIPHFERALDMQSRWFQVTGELLSESAALTLLTTNVSCERTYLSATAAADIPAEQVYRRVWQRKAQATRILERRQTAARLAQARDPAVAKTYAELREVRREIARVLTQTTRNYTARDAYLADLGKKRNALEDAVRAALPPSPAPIQRPDELRAALPPDAAFIDIFVHGNADEGTTAYSLFVLTRDGPIRRVTIRDAASLEAAIAEWLQDITSGQSPSGAAIAERLWKPIAPLLPPGIKNLYVAGDGKLQLLPWAALPAGDGVILLERFAFAQVPHGAFLAEHLLRPKRVGNRTNLLLVGDLGYGSTTWPALPGTRREIDALAQISPAPPTLLAGRQATPARIATELVKANVAHFATHGFFNADEYDAERRRFIAQSRRLIGVSANPFDGDLILDGQLAYSGLVLSDGEPMSAEGIVNLSLDQLDLCTLSACESGQGTRHIGEGVFGPVRAFHLAGCPNVVASLWKVNDAATAALMAKFYHELWVNNKEPLAALREAQLFIYHHPELVPELAGERGAPKRSEALAARPAKPRAARLPTRLWAGFVLSGAGR